ncbi:MAG: hypothetical protein IJQ39_01850 [Thermoguttaceae bacterium]|nr:hypothetical protein [Thermoguttaceae bacterium]
MKLYFTVKRLDRISDLTADDSNPLTKQEFDFDPAPKTLRELLTQLVKHNVLEYEKKIPELPNKTRPQVNKSVETVIQAFEDGLFRAFSPDGELTQLDEPLSLADGSTLTFIRLAFLAGSYF